MSHLSDDGSWPDDAIRESGGSEFYEPQEKKLGFSIFDLFFVGWRQETIARMKRNWTALTYQKQKEPAASRVFRVNGHL